jgi:hypothetical protein
MDRRKAQYLSLKQGQQGKDKTLSWPLPERHLRVNRREVKQYSKYKPKKRHLPPPASFGSQEHFLDFSNCSIRWQLCPPQGPEEPKVKGIAPCGPSS